MLSMSACEEEEEVRCREGQEGSGDLGAHAARGERVDCLTRVGNFLPVCVLYKGEEGLAPLVDAEV